MVNALSLALVSQQRRRSLMGLHWARIIAIIPLQLHLGVGGRLCVLRRDWSRARRDELWNFPESHLSLPTLQPRLLEDAGLGVLMRLTRVSRMWTLSCRWRRMKERKVCSRAGSDTALRKRSRYAVVVITSSRVSFTEGGSLRHDEQQSVSGLLAHRALPVDEGDEQGEDQEVSGPLILAGVEKQLQNGRVLGQHAAELVEQQHQLRLHLRSRGAGAGGQQHHEGPQDGLVVQEGLLRLAHQHLVHLQLLQLHVVRELSAQAPHEQALHHVLHHHKLQDGAHGSGLPAVLLHQQEQHVLHIVLHGARLVSGDGAEPRGAAGAEADDAQGVQGGTAAQGVMLL
ncbi:hypothetical protein F7725_005836 [Dissostichus mawsoni]|uniref:Uncharacterized protein n=1 Tax=Dissostichus mawsoni TaxID=36200 RepID=A0A7J5YUI4_DISMA|nr:hypothetical protein F7725_005836 [Dissostichus mawsoni]